MSAETRLAHYRRLESQLATLKQAVAEKEREIDAFLLSLSAVKVGDVVALRGGTRARVAEVTTRWMRPTFGDSFGDPAIKVNLPRKDGTWSTAVRDPGGDWSLPTPGPTP